MSHIGHIVYKWLSSVDISDYKADYKSIVNIVDKSSQCYINTFQCETELSVKIRVKIGTSFNV